MRTRALVAIAVLITSLLPSSANAGVDPTPVKTTSRDEFGGSGNASFFAWTRGFGGGTRRLPPSAAEARVQPAGQSSYPIDVRAHAFTGQMDPVGTVLPYQRVSLNRARSDLRLFDLSTQEHLPLPPGINGNNWEMWPAIHGNQMTFVRDGRSTETLFLVTDLSTGDKVVLKSIDKRRATFANVPHINGNWVTWAICNRQGCHAYRYDIANEVAEQIPNPLGRYYFAPSPDLAGNVYFERSRRQCGRAARMMKWTGVGDPTVFYAFDRGTDMTGSSTFDDGAGTITVYVDFLDCGTDNRDIYSFSNP